mgnify:CR=1 FL=1
MKRFGTRSATGKMVKLKLPVDVESLLIEASNRSGRSRSFEAVIRLKDLILPSNSGHAAK